MRNLTSKQLEILKNKLPSYQERRIKLLLSLDVKFMFNRSKLSEYLVNQGLYGYSRYMLYQILGKPILRSGEYKRLKTIFIKRGLDLIFLQLLISKRVYIELTKLCDGHSTYHYDLDGIDIE